MFTKPKCNPQNVTVFEDFVPVSDCWMLSYICRCVSSFRFDLWASRTFTLFIQRNTQRKLEETLSPGSQTLSWKLWMSYASWMQMQLRLLMMSKYMLTFATVREDSKGPSRTVSHINTSESLRDEEDSMALSNATWRNACFTSLE